MKISEEQKKAAKESVNKLQPLINTTSKAVFTQSSKILAKKLNLSKADHCKNIERKFGKKEAAKEFKNWR